MYLEEHWKAPMTTACSGSHDERRATVSWTGTMDTIFSEIHCPACLVAALDKAWEAKQSFGGGGLADWNRAGLAGRSGTFLLLTPLVGGGLGSQAVPEEQLVYSTLPGQ